MKGRFVKWHLWSELFFWLLFISPGSNAVFYAVFKWRRSAWFILPNYIFWCFGYYFFVFNHLFFIFTGDKKESVSEIGRCTRENDHPHLSDGVTRRDRSILLLLWKPFSVFCSKKPVWKEGGPSHGSHSSCSKSPFGSRLHQGTAVRAALSFPSSLVLCSNGSKTLGSLFWAETEWGCRWEEKTHFDKYQ